MSRYIRPNLPGMPFHVTARVQNQERLFTGAEHLITRIILQEAEVAEARLLAFAVMPNHLHLIVVQPREPLASLMQPLLRRIALLLQRRHGRIGHVFERRYGSSPCGDAEYLRNAIVYVHLNPVRAGLRRTARGYAWSSHHDYCGRATRADHPSCSASFAEGLRLFARARCGADDECRRDYVRFLLWRRRMDRFNMSPLGIRGPEAEHPGYAPAADGGDALWNETFSRTTPSGSQFLPRRDLRDVVGDTVRREEPNMPLDLVRSPIGGRRVTAVRRIVIAECLKSGYTGTQIATYLRISTSAVSTVAVMLRRGPMTGSVMCMLR